jgi:hypothetical protein
MTEEQYKILSTQRISQDTMVWRTPALAMATQAFLLASAFNSQTERTVGLVPSGFSFIVGVASIQLMSRHRFIEVLASKRMEAFEVENESKGYSVIHRRYSEQELAEGEWIARWPSFLIWRSVLMGFCALATYAFILKFMDP